MQHNIPEFLLELLLKQYGKNTTKSILSLLRDINKKLGITIIIVTHNDAIKNMADRVITLRDGRIRKNYVNDNKIAAADLEW